MQITTIKLHSLSYTQAKTYLFTAFFVIGNIVLPQLAHTIPQGGFIFLPIYFFTLIAAYKYGWKIGVMTAVLSPVVNHILFGMPPLTVLPAILTKSVFLAITAAIVAKHFKRISIPILFSVVLTYQIFGTLVEWAIVGDFFKAVQDFRIGVPGMLLQIIGGFLVITILKHK